MNQVKLICFFILYMLIISGDSISQSYPKVIMQPTTSFTYEIMRNRTQLSSDHMTPPHRATSWNDIQHDLRSHLQNHMLLSKYHRYHLHYRHIPKYETSFPESSSPTTQSSEKLGGTLPSFMFSLQV